MTAIVLGATGLTGSHLIDLLLEDKSIEKIKIFGRRALGVEHPKIEEHLMDLFELEKAKKDFEGDVVFCCIGTTKKKTPDKEIYKKIDYGIPVTAAQLAKQNQIEKYIVISALGANPESRFFYNRTKGAMERDVKAAHIPKTYILRPSLITGNRKEKRVGEDLGGSFSKIFDFLIPKKYKQIKAKTIAHAMLKLVHHDHPKSVIASEEIKALGAKNP